MPSADHRFGPQNLNAPAGVVTREPKDRSPEHAEPTGFLPHVQGLRAIAVLCVVLYHFWPGRFPGGYVGVDVFFVISGFLITAHLMRELTATGTVRLGQFWARRAR
ncbi:acyltransferase family protein, partial [Microbacterium aurantiacum]